MFPHIGEQIFKQLSNKNLAKCRKVTKSWEHFISNQRFYKQRVKYEVIQKQRNNIGRTHLHQVAKAGNLSECKSIVYNVEDKNPNIYGVTPLHLAAGNGHFEVCKLIVNNVENKNPNSIHGVAPPKMLQFDHLTISQLINKNIAGKIARNLDGYTPLHEAAIGGHFEIFKLIFDNVEEKNPLGSIIGSPLDLATNFGHHQMADYIRSNIDI